MNPKLAEINVHGAFRLQFPVQHGATSRLPDPADLFVLAAYGATTFLVVGLFFRHMNRGFADVL